jgi:hypothetical protein
MSSYLPPTEVVPIYNPSNYLQSDATGLSIATADLRYLQLSGGTERGSVVFSSGLTSVGAVSITNTTQSTTTSTGSLIIAGGVGIAKDLYTAGSAIFTGASSVLTLANTAASTSSSTGSVRTQGGFYAGASSLIGAGNLTLTNGSVISTALGTPSATAFSVGQANTGIYSASAGVINIATSGASRFQVSGSSIQMLLATRFTSGTAAAPSVSFSSDAGNDSGLYLVGQDNIGFTAGGTLAFDYNPTRLNSAIPIQASSIGALTGKKISWMDQGTSGTIASVNSGNGTGTTTITFNSSAPTTTGMVVLINPTSGTGNDKLTYAAVSYTTGGCTINASNPSATNATSIQFTYVAMVLS